MTKKISKLLNLCFLREIYSFITPSVDISHYKSDYINLIENPNNQYIELFETSLSNYLGGGDVITFAAGRMSFYSLLLYWGIKKGDEVALTGFTCAVMANAVIRTGATPIFIDIDEDTLGMSPKDLLRKVTPKTKVIVAQHSFGIPCKIDIIKDIAKKSNCWLVEDCALTLGSSYKEITLGNWGDAAIFSTDHTKPLNLLIGGFVYTLNKENAVGIRNIRDNSCDLSIEHQKLLLKWYLKEHQLEETNHKRYIFSNYLHSIKNKLKIPTEPLPYLQNESSSKINHNSFYGYPSKMPSFIAKIGLDVLSNYVSSIEDRRRKLSEMLSICSQFESLPSAYYDENCTIIPLRLAYVSRSVNILKFRYIDDWVWFKKPIVATNEALYNFGYIDGSCPISECIGNDIMNLPIILDDKKYEGFKLHLLKTYK